MKTKQNVIRILGAVAVVSGLCCVFGADAAAEERPPWRDPRVFAVNRLPARAVAVPCENEELALAIARGEKPRTASRWIESLNGVWHFQWKHSVEVATWEKEGPVTVPGCWQLQGAYDPPNYTNSRYPIAGYETGDPLAEPPRDFTSHYYRPLAGRHGSVAAHGLPGRGGRLP